MVDFDTASLAELEALLLGDDAQLRSDAATALGDRLRTHELDELPADLRELLVTLLDDATPMVRFEAAVTLAEAHDRRATTLLMSASETHRFRLDAVRALGAMGDTRAIPHLTKMLDRFLMPWADKMQAAAALCALGDTRGAQYLESKLTSRRQAERAAAVHFIGESRHPDARRILTSMIDDAKHPLRDVAEHALGLLGGT
jgi:HEAT repeat protein